MSSEARLAEPVRKFIEKKSVLNSAGDNEKFAMIKSLTFLLPFIFLIFPQGASAAKAPSAVECDIEISGKALDDLVKLLGLKADNPSVQFELSSFTAWAVYQLRQDTPQKLWNTEGQPKRYNSVSLRVGSNGAPILLFKPFWLDQGTALPNFRPGVYSFTLETVDENSTEDSPQARLVKILKNSPDWRAIKEKRQGEIAYEKQFRSTDGIPLKLVVYGMNIYSGNTVRWGYAVSFEVEAPGKCGRN